MRLELTIPTDLSEITLEQYQKYLKAIDEAKTEYEIGSKMIEIFCNVEYEDVYKFKMSQITNISKTLERVFQQETPDLIKHFKIDNIEYGFIPNLDEMTFGEYVDLDTYLKDWQEMHRSMNVLFRPVTQKFKGKYNIDVYKPNGAELIKKMPMDVCFSSIVFFYNLGKELSRTILHYLNPQEIAQLHQSEISQQNGVGINQFLHSLKKMLDTSKILLN